MTVFFTSDPHFRHARINELAGRPFASTEECDAAMIDRWNSRVNRDDSVICVGDVSLGPIRESLALTMELNGLRFLVPGNHDRVHPAYRMSDAKRREAFALYQLAGWTILGLQEQHEFWDGTVADVCHFPYAGDSHGEDRYPEYRPTDEGRWLIHGHVHEAWKVNGRQINVGMDVWDFTPVSEDEILELMYTGS